MASASHEREAGLLFQRGTARGGPPQGDVGAGGRSRPLSRVRRESAGGVRREFIGDTSRPPLDVGHVAEVPALSLAQDHPGDEASGALLQAAAEGDVPLGVQPRHDAPHPGHGRDVPLGGRRVQRAAAEQPHRTFGQGPAVPPDEPAGILVPPSGVQASADHDGVVPRHVIDQGGRCGIGCEASRAQDAGDRLGDAGRGAVGRPVGDQYLLGHGDPSSRVIHRVPAQRSRRR